MNVRLVPFGTPERTILYTSIVRVRFNLLTDTFDLVSSDRTLLTIHRKSYADVSIDDDGAVT